MPDDLADVGPVLHAGAVEDLLDLLDARAADQMVGTDLGGRASGGELVLLGLRHDLDPGLMTVRADVVHQRLELLGGESDVLAADVADARLSDRGVDLARV
jgi:hypothetical protein